MRTIGSEAIFIWRTDLGTFFAIGALYCCNDPAGILLADRGWAMDDRPTGLFERLALPGATRRLFHLPVPGCIAEFEEIDGCAGWYAGFDWQTELGKISVVRYDNGADAAAYTTRDTAWATHFWSIGARTQTGLLVVIAQGLPGDTLTGNQLRFSARFFF